jgi:hypothetical protein
MTLLELRTLVDDKLSSLWDVIVSRQGVFYQNHGRYWQGIFIPSVIPENGFDVDIYSDVIAPKEVLGWGDMGIDLGGKLCFQLFVDEYKTPDGECGFVAHVFVIYNGKQYGRSRGYGVLAESNTVGWHEIKP